MDSVHIGDRMMVDVIKSGTILPKVMANEANTRMEESKDDAFYYCDIGDMIKKHQNWLKLLPRVEPFYAVKCNDDTAVVQILANIGTNFDCASKGEIKKVLDLGVSPDRIIYANPCKQQSHIQFAARNGVAMMTFDNMDELHKVKNCYPNAKLVLRILPGEFKSQCQLGCKFGCHPNHALKLLKKAKELDLNVMGISFHVGSGCMEPEAFPAAIRLAREVFDTAVNLGFSMEMLDIGGGYPGDNLGPVSFKEICEGINTSLDQSFPPESGIRIIAEPGRYYIASACTLAVNVISKRTVSRDNQDLKDPDDEDAVCNSLPPSKNEEPAFMYYVNDGVYGSFNCLMFDHASVTPTLMNDRSCEHEYSSSIWGPTCDGIDCISNHSLLPELEVGDWIVFENMGAYTMAAASCFNGMSKPTGHYVIREEMLKYLPVLPYPHHVTSCRQEETKKTQYGSPSAFKYGSPSKEFYFKELLPVGVGIGH
ncbi:ornithine decarboxylase-like [Lineus longissimus]|uniref:ornithine decarboxylase-like n=1 Tax=Lineus longissimus TaxID=88925 RepID=UPI002B4E6C29